MRAILTANSGSLLPFQVLIACQLIPASRKIWRTVSVLTTTSLDRLHVVNGSPSCAGAVLATPGRRSHGRPTRTHGVGRRSNAAKPRVVERVDHLPRVQRRRRDIAAASAALRPCTEASTIPARRSRTRSRAVLAILTRRLSTKLSTNQSCPVPTLHPNA